MISFTIEAILSYTSLFTNKAPNRACSASILWGCKFDSTSSGACELPKGLISFINSPAYLNNKIFVINYYDTDDFNILSGYPVDKYVF